MIKRIREAARKDSKYLWDVLNTRPPRLIYIGGWLGHHNLGDEALFDASKRIFDRYSLLHYPMNGGRVVRIPSRVFKVAVGAVLAGGTLINRGRYLDSARECFDIFPKFFVFGTGVAAPSFWSGRKGWVDSMALWKPLLEKCRYIGVRGPISAELLRNIGLSNVEVIGDPVLAFGKDQQRNKVSYIPNSVGLNIGHSYGNVWGSEESIKTEFIELARLAREAGWKVRWFVVWSEDIEITRQTAQASRTTEEIYEIYEDPSRYLDLVRPMSTFVGMKLHAVALATCAYVPSIMVEYRPKCRDYMRAIGQDTATVRSDQLRGDNIWEMIKYWNSQRPRMSNLLYKAIKPVRDKQRQKADELFKTFEGSND